MLPNKGLKWLLSVSNYRMVGEGSAHGASRS